jgi:hypothetical protein
MMRGSLSQALVGSAIFVGISFLLVNIWINLL